MRTRPPVEWRPAAQVWTWKAAAAWRPMFTSPAVTPLPGAAGAAKEPVNQVLRVAMAAALRGEVNCTSSTTAGAKLPPL